jgi:hypothetical protein
MLMAMLLMAGIAKADAQIIERATEWLTKRPKEITIVDSNHERLVELRPRTVAAFVIEGEPMIYVNRDSWVFKCTAGGDRMCALLLAATICHEMAHVDGADEVTAQKAEEALWKRFMLAGYVSRAKGEAYLQEMLARRKK